MLSEEKLDLTFLFSDTVANRPIRDLREKLTDEWHFERAVYCVPLLTLSNPTQRPWQLVPSVIDYWPWRRRFIVPYVFFIIILLYFCYCKTNTEKNQEKTNSSAGYRLYNYSLITSKILIFFISSRVRRGEGVAENMERLTFLTLDLLFLLLLFYFLRRRRTNFGPEMCSWKQRIQWDQTVIDLVGALSFRSIFISTVCPTSLTFKL